ncbi:HAMP domain-containing sensor histidine kinase [Lysinibacillus sp. KU-BSD001]|uniref:sensor histidine kinase n=1 Tax=Lysinibacillus sp. KU-BSD001 TaxID=3141328 RepID=UPI0036F0EB90
MNKISTKLATYFFIVVLILELFLMYYLHQNMINTRVEEEFSLLLANGANHRDVLVENFTDMTIKHIILMEKNENREVAITNSTGDIINSSDQSYMLLEEYNLLINDLHNKKDEVIVSDWRRSPYIVSAHPYKVSEKQSGYVLMFQSTNSMNQMVNSMNLHFVISGVTIFIVLFVVYAILSKVLTRPLIRMKEATEKLSKGDFNVSLPRLGKDEIGELSSSIQKLANDLQHFKSERNEFLASIAHELSTPLTYLIGYSKVAMRKELSEGERNHYLEIIGEESERMKNLVKNLLDLARIDETSFTISKQYFWARPFFENIYKLVAPSYETKKMKLNLVCEKDFQIYADPIRLEQIMLNLLDNALKYSDENSEVTIEAYNKERETIISVTDTGIGIPSDELEFIFEKLYRVEKSRSRIYGGSGIGLAVVKELVEAHDGTINVKSKVGEGSIFTITL